jgi:hypothetical protein
VVAAIVQVALADCITWFNVKPDVFIAGLFCACMVLSARWSLVFALCAGLLRDAFCGPMAGNGMVLYVGWWMVMVQLSRMIAVDTFPVRRMFLAAVVAANSLVVRPLFFRAPGIPWGILVRTMLLEAVYTALAGFLLLEFLQALRLRTREREEEPVDLEAETDEDYSGVSEYEDR